MGTHFSVVYFSNKVTMFFQDVYFSRGTLSQKRGEKGHLAG